jgi:hypothetical protein
MLNLSRSRIIVSITGVTVLIIGIIVNNSILHTDSETEINRKKSTGTIFAIIGTVLLSWSNGLGLFIIALFGGFFGIESKPFDDVGAIDYFGTGLGR